MSFAAMGQPAGCRDYYFAVFERADGSTFSRAWAVTMPCEFAAYAPMWFDSFIANYFYKYDVANGMIGMMFNPTWTVDMSPLALPEPMPAVVLPTLRFNADRKWRPINPPDDPRTDWLQRAAFKGTLWTSGPWHPFVDDGGGQGWVS